MRADVNGDLVLGGRVVPSTADQPMCLYIQCAKRLSNRMPECVTLLDYINR